MLSAGGLWLAFGGFIIGAACVWLRSGRIRAELARTRWVAEHDSLTGLANRTGIRARFEAERCAGRQNSLVLLDLNGFKQVNDTFGHQVGDRLLAEVARRLTEACRKAGFPGRLGGDEFVILLPRSTQAEDAAFVQTLLAQIATPITVDDGTHRPAAIAATASAGIATAGPDGTWSTQLRQADIALYQAKARPGGIVVFQAGMRHPTRAPGDRHRAVLAAEVLAGGMAR